MNGCPSVFAYCALFVQLVTIISDSNLSRQGIYIFHVAMSKYIHNDSENVQQQQQNQQTA